MTVHNLDPLELFSGNLKQYQEQISHRIKLDIYSTTELCRQATTHMTNAGCFFTTLDTACNLAQPWRGSVFHMTWTLERIFEQIREKVSQANSYSTSRGYMVLVFAGPKLANDLKQEQVFLCMPLSIDNLYTLKMSRCHIHNLHMWHDVLESTLRQEGGDVSTAILMAQQIILAVNSRFEHFSTHIDDIQLTRVRVLNSLVQAAKLV